MLSCCFFFFHVTISMQNSHYRRGLLIRLWRHPSCGLTCSSNQKHWYLTVHKWQSRIRSCHSLSVTIFSWTFAVQFPRSQRCFLLLKTALFPRSTFFFSCLVVLWILYIFLINNLVLQPNARLIHLTFFILALHLLSFFSALICQTVRSLHFFFFFNFIGHFAI